jgi:hypothetical protein
MLPIPISFIEKNVHSYQQTCKRARNVLDAIVRKRYVISEKKWLRTVHYEVNVFGEIQHKFGSTKDVLEHMLDMDHISPLDYQLLKFYDLSNGIDMVLEKMDKRRTVDNLVPVSLDELQLLYDIGNFAEDPALTKEELLSGEQLRQT